MKKKIIVALMISTFCISAVGCGKKEEGERQRASVNNTSESTIETETSAIETEDSADITIEDTDYEAIYSETLDTVYEILSSDSNDYDKYYDMDGFGGVTEIGTYLDAGEALSSVGYCINDISGDGIPELIIANVDYDDSNGTKACDVLAVFTTSNGKVINALESYSRSMFRYCGDGLFSYFGSGGAAYMMAGSYHITENGFNVVCDEFYFTAEYSGDYEDIRYYYNQTGEWDIDNSEIVPESDYSEWDDVWSDKVTYLDVIPFTEYGGGSSDYGEAITYSAGDIEVGYSQTVMMYFDYVDAEYEFDDSQFSVWLTLYATEPVTNLEFYALEGDVNEAGEISYIETFLDSYGDLESDVPVSFKIAFPGELASYGFSYEDKYGNERRFALMESGYDGSIIAEEY